MRKYLAIWVTKFLIWAGKVAGKAGSSTPGRFGLKICPSLLADLASQVKEGIFVVCGTNGKTTTNNLLCAALRSEGKTVVCNNVGANMLNGVATAFIAAADMRGRLAADYACIEVDEASTLRVFPHFHPNFLVLTNLFRDQLDRYGEIDITMDIFKKALALSPETKLIVNADDPLSVALAVESGHPCVCYGVNEDTGFSQYAAQETKEGRFCRLCGAELVYRFYHYSQLGDYACPSCGFHRPDPTYAATQVNTNSGIQFTVEGRRFSVDYHGFYNVYNMLAAYAAARESGAGLEHFQQVLDDYHPQNGRMERFSLAKPVVLNLAKNPAGFNQNISALLEDGGSKDVIVLINDNEQDGQDVSWLWDVDFERLKQANVVSYGVCGIRGRDMQVRFKYAGIHAQLYTGVEEAVRNMLPSNAETLYVLVNYTGLFATHNVLKRMETQGGGKHE